jgi:hypothetical protein
MSLARRSAPVALSLLVVACGGPASSPSTRAADLERAMAYGRIVELNDIESASEKGLLVRIFQVPILDGDCAPETHRACEHRLFVSVATFDEQPQTNVFDLGIRGEIASARWLPTEVPDGAALALSIQRIARTRGDEDAALDVQMENVRLEVTPTKLVERGEGQ